MKFTNKYNLPASLVRAITSTVSEPHNKPNCYSITTLQQGPKETQLMNRHFDEIETDVSKELWAVFGTAIHTLLERNARVEDGTLAEYSMKQKVYIHDDTPLKNCLGEIFITGKCDLFRDDNGEPVIEDYKTTKTLALSYDDTISKWREQLLGYCTLLQCEAIRVRKVRIYALLKDWSELEYHRNKDNGYPDAPVQVLSWEFSDEDITEEWESLWLKAREQFYASVIEDDMISPCTAEQRWAKPPVYAITKEGASRATKRCETIEEAEELLRTKYNSKQYYIDERPGEDTKCLHFCKCKNFCNYYKQTYSVQLKSSEEQDG